MRSLGCFIKVLLAGLAGAGLAGCAGEETLSPLPAVDTYDVEAYALRGEYDWGRDRLVATVGITLSPLVAELRGVTLDSEVAEVKAVRAEGGGALPFAVGGGELEIDLAGVEAREGEEVTIEIDYEAAPGDSFRAIPSREGDPVSARVVYTFSEPEAAPQWMPCHDAPHDRALFSVEMRMDAGESLIANGDEVLDAAGGEGRRMGYATRYSLPTYLMAFAISDFEVTEGEAGEVPISVWRRRGLAGDFEGILGGLDREIRLFEGLAGAYPFEKYALVVLPDFLGGEEHAGITFQNEAGTTRPELTGDSSLRAHELGHQWFGDLMTVAAWDDLWIKEGMAVLLSAEAARAFEDQGGAGTLGGERWWSEDGAAIRDVSRAPHDKYTSGPYNRAAWLFTQIRSVVGEEAFWGTWRALLEEHRFGAVSTDEVLSAFAPALGPEGAGRARRAVDAMALPAIEVRASGGGRAVMTLRDPERILVAPIEIAWAHLDGTESRAALAAGVPLEITPPVEGDLLVLDPDDVHPDVWSLVADEASGQSFGELVAPLRWPSTAAQVARFSTLSGVHQRSVLLDGLWPPVGPEGLGEFVRALHSEGAKAAAIPAACNAAIAEEDPQAREAWRAALEGALLEEPRWRGLGYVGNHDACGEIVPPLELFAPEWAELAAGLDAPSVPEDRLFFLSKMTIYSDSGAREAWGGAARSAYSVRARTLAARQVQRYARGVNEAIDLDAWRGLVLELIGSSEAPEVLRPLMPAVIAVSLGDPAADADLLAALSEILRKPVTRTAHSTALCAAYGLAGGQGAAWDAFAAGLDPGALSGAARALLAEPSGCYH